MLKNGRGWHNPVGETPKAKKYNKSGANWRTAEDCKTLGEIKKGLCDGWDSICAVSTCPSECAFGRKWGEVWNYALPDGTEKLAPITIKGTYESRKANHLCVYCGRPLPTWETKVGCAECREQRNAKALYHTKKKVLV